MLGKPAAQAPGEGRLRQRALAEGPHVALVGEALARACQDLAQGREMWGLTGMCIYLHPFGGWLKGGREGGREGGRAESEISISSGPPQ